MPRIGQVWAAFGPDTLLISANLGATSNQFGPHANVRANLALALTQLGLEFTDFGPSSIEIVEPGFDQLCAIRGGGAMIILERSLSGRYLLVACP